LGKAKEAGSYLQEQTAAFHGDREEQVFLLNLAGRLINWDWRLDADRDRYCKALSDLQAGNTKSAVARCCKKR
jgi:hypothetical protein